MKKTFLFYLFFLGIIYSSIAQDADFYINMGDNLYDKSDYAGAIRAYTKGLEIFKDNDELYSSRADAKNKLEDHKGAITDLSEAIRLNPKEAQYYIYRADIKYKTIDYTGAINDCTKAIQLDKSKLIAYSTRGKSKLKLNDKTACDDFKVIGEETLDLWIAFEDIKELHNKNCK
jgi:tetratricopeptide (TPR) repeat protein